MDYNTIESTITYLLRDLLETFQCVKVKPTKECLCLALSDKVHYFETVDNKTSDIYVEVNLCKFEILSPYYDVKNWKGYYVIAFNMDKNVLVGYYDITKKETIYLGGIIPNNMFPRSFKLKHEGDSMVISLIDEDQGKEEEVILEELKKEKNDDR